MRKSTKVYALYKGDKFVTLGTYQEISAETGISVKVLQCAKTKASKVKKDGMIVIEIEEDEQ